MCVVCVERAMCVLRRRRLVAAAVATTALSVTQLDRDRELPLCAVPRCCCCCCCCCWARELSPCLCRPHWLWKAAMFVYVCVDVCVKGSHDDTDSTNTAAATSCPSTDLHGRLPLLVPPVRGQHGPATLIDAVSIARPARHCSTNAICGPLIGCHIGTLPASFSAV